MPLVSLHVFLCCAEDSGDSCYLRSSPVEGLMSCFRLWRQSPEGLEPESFPQQPFSLQRRVSVPCELLISCQLQLSDAADADKRVVSLQERFEMVPADALDSGPVTVSKTQEFVTQVRVVWHD